MNVCQWLIFISISFILFLLLFISTLIHKNCPVGWGCRIHRLHLHKGVRLPSNECPVYDTKQSDGDVPVMLDFWGIRNTEYPSIAIATHAVASDRVLCMCHIEIELFGSKNIKIFDMLFCNQENIESSHGLVYKQSMSLYYISFQFSVFKSKRFKLSVQLQFITFRIFMKSTHPLHFLSMLPLDELTTKLHKSFTTICNYNKMFKVVLCATIVKLWWLSRP